MSGYAALLDTMMQAIWKGEAAPAGFVRHRDAFPACAQLAVYVDAYRIRLAAVLEGAYPALSHYIGKDAFGQAVRHYVETHRPHHFNIDRYPPAFAGFVAGLNSMDAAARELARLEGCMAEVWLAEETAPLNAQWAESRTIDSLAHAVLMPRTASRLLAFRHNVDGYVAAFRDGGDPSAPAQGAQYLLVLRHRHRLARHRLEEGEYRLLALLARGITLAQALEDKTIPLYTADAAFASNLTRWFTRWAKEGFLRQPD